MYFPSTEVASGEWKVVCPESPSMRQKWEILRGMARMTPVDANYFDIKCNSSFWWSTFSSDSPVEYLD